MEEISCLFCHDRHNRVVIEENGFKGRKCDACSLIYISPRPALGEVLDIYGHGQAQVSASIHIAGDFLKRLYARHTLQRIKQYRSSGSLLELGAGAGYFLDEARRAGFSGAGIELNPRQADFIEHTLKISCERMPLSNTSFGPRLFDIIYHSDVLSHFHDPIAVFNTIHEKLADDGYVIFETGNIADINERYYPAFAQFQYPDHLFFFGEDSLKKLLTITGFTVRALHRYSIVPQLKLMRLLGRDKLSPMPSGLPKPTKRAFAWLAPWYHRVLYATRYKLGSCMPKQGRPQTVLVVAQKTKGEKSR